MKDTFNLEGLFNKEGISEEKALPFSEEEVLNTLIRGSEYEPKDIIAIAFGKSDEKQDRKIIDAILLTERGLKESEQKDLKEKYSKLNELSRVGKLADSIKGDKLFSTIAHLFVYNGFKKHFHPGLEPLRIEYHNLGGSDGKKRIIKLYITDTQEE